MEFHKGVLIATLLSVANVFAAGDHFNFNWRFAKGDQSAAVQAGYDDTGWERVDLPHDWAIHHDFDPNGDPGTGQLPWQGEGWYRKHFNLAKDAAGKRLQFTFDGVIGLSERQGSRLLGLWL